MADADSNDRGFSRWLTPSAAIEAIDAIEAHEGLDPLGLDETKAAILLRLKAGKLRAAAEWISQQTNGVREDFTIAVVGPESWEDFTDQDLVHFWLRGDITSAPHTNERTYLVNVRLNPKDIEALARRRAPLLRPQIKRHGGGRPPNPHWEEAINAIWAALHGATLIPNTQAEIETRLADWFAAANLEEPGPTQIRQRARMIWAACRGMVGN